MAADSHFLIQDSVLIRTVQGRTLSAGVVRQQAWNSPLPTALLSFLYTILGRRLAEAKAAADHGYVGVVADVRGKGFSPDFYFN